SGWMEIDGERVEMDPDTIVRVGPNAKRKVFAGAQGIRMLVVGATPGAAYEIVPATELTAA
ncbi:MAG: hypothetical protein ACRDK2_10335, partial [Solirubrobacteraceae bacterium]